ncbi:MAG: hypothetical protein WBC73_13250, partial [Phormidesmis sp.]
MTLVNSATELVGAVVHRESKIEISGDIGKGIVSIKATGDVSWVIAIGAIGAGAALFIGSGGSAALIAGTAAVA